MKQFRIRHRQVANLSHTVLYVLVSLAALVFGMFYLFGYDSPYDEDPRFNAPLFTDVLLLFMVLLAVVSLASVVWALVTGVRKRDRKESAINGVPAQRIYYGTGAFTLVALLVNFALGSSSPVEINGTEYTDTLWLKTADMLINTSLTLLVAGVAIIVYGYVKVHRKGGK